MKGAVTHIHVVLLASSDLQSLGDSSREGGGGSTDTLETFTLHLEQFSETPFQAEESVNREAFYSIIDHFKASLLRIAALPAPLLPLGREEEHPRFEIRATAACGVLPETWMLHSTDAETSVERDLTDTNHLRPRRVSGRMVPLDAFDLTASCRLTFTCMNNTRAE